MSLKMIDEELPSEIFHLATNCGNELGWRLEDVKYVVEIAKKNSLGIVGGQVQFRFPGATCELYWVNADPDPWNENDKWDEYIDRSYTQFINLFDQNVASRDIIREGMDSFPIIVDKMKQGLNPFDYLYFLIYFTDKSDTEG